MKCFLLMASLLLTTQQVVRAFPYEAGQVWVKTLERVGVIDLAEQAEIEPMRLAQLNGLSALDSFEAEAWVVLPQDVEERLFLVPSIDYDTATHNKPETFADDNLKAKMDRLGRLVRDSALPPVHARQTLRIPGVNDYEPNTRSRTTARLIEAEKRWRWFGNKAVDWSRWKQQGRWGNRYAPAKGPWSDYKTVVAVGVNCEALRIAWHVESTLTAGYKDWSEWKTPQVGTRDAQLMAALCDNI